MKKGSPVSRSGRFASGPAADVARFTESISFDWRLWRHDILGSIAPAAMLRKAGLLRPAALKAITWGPGAIGQEIGHWRFGWEPELGDLPMNNDTEVTR